MRKFSIGNKIKCHGFFIGTIISLEYYDVIGVYTVLWTRDEKNHHYMSESSMELIEEEEIEWIDITDEDEWCL